MSAEMKNSPSIQPNGNKKNSQNKKNFSQQRIPYLFVYGFLLSQERWRTPFPKMLEEKLSFVGEGLVRGRLYLIEDYPGLILDPGKKENVFGEIYKIADLSILRILDSYEGFTHNDMKNSEFIRVVTKSKSFATGGNLLDVHCYVYNKEVEGKQRILHGNFAKFAKK